MDRLNIEAKRFVDSICKKFINIYGSQLKSIIVYGSALTEFFNPKKSDINLLIVLDNTDIGQLKKSIPIIKRYGRRINPLLVTREYILTSQDVYPMEFLEIKDNYMVIYGEDVLQDIHIDRQYLRLECEQQLKGALLKLRQGFLRGGLGGIKRLVNDSVSSVFTIFRNLIRIKGKEPPVNKAEVIDEMVALYNIDKELFKSILRYKSGEGRIDVEEVFHRYIKELERLTILVDEL